MDVFLIIVVCILAVLLLYVNVYLLALYCHPQDGGFGASLFCKLVVLIGLTLSWAQILMLSLDITNERTQAGLDMQLCWMIIYISVFVMIVFLIPISTFYYESDEDKSIVDQQQLIYQCSRLCSTLLQEFIVLVFAFLIIFLSYYWLQDAEVPVTVMVIDANEFQDSNSIVNTYQEYQYDSSIKLPVSIITFTVGLMSFLGYIPLILYGGIGLSALPLDLILSYRIRPVFKTSAQALQKKNELKQKVKQLIQYAQQLKEEEKDLKFTSGWLNKRSKKSRVEKLYTNLLKSVQNIEEQYEIFKMELDIGNTNPLGYIIKLILGILLFLITLTWWLHLLLYVIIQYNDIPISPFLNKLFIDLEIYNVNFLSIFFFGLFTLYLLWSVTKGNIVFNLPWIFSFHPMKINETWMNSFLFNIMLILLSSVALTHFSTRVFSQYARLTTVDLLFGIQIQYLKLFSWAYTINLFEYMLFSWSIFTALIYGIISCRKPNQLTELEERKKKVGDTEIELKQLFLKK